MSASCPLCGAAGGVPFRSRYTVSLLTCPGCGVRYVWPPPSARQLIRRYEREHEAGTWTERMDLGPEDEPERRAALLRRLRWPDPREARDDARGLLLDVGFGDGRFLRSAQLQDWRCVGTEIALAAARPLAGAHRVAVADLDALVDAEVFDAVTFWDVLEHLADPGAAVAGAVRRLRPGGVLAASMPSLSSTTARVEGAGWRYYDLDTYGHLVHMTPRHLRTLFDAHGLEIAHVETRGSVDLRDSFRFRERGWRGLGGAVLDRVSGLLARVAVPLRLGNTLLVVGRKPTSRRGA